MIKRTLKIALRNLNRNRVSTVINIIGLSIGLAATIIIVVWISNQFSYDTFYPDSGQLYRISFTSTTEGHVSNFETSPFPLAARVKAETPTVEFAAMYFPFKFDNPAFRTNGDAFYETEGVYADSNWFNVFKYDFIQGSARQFGDHSSSVIITSSTAKKHFGTEYAVGKSLMAGNYNLTVAGVIKENPENSSFHFPLFLPMGVHLSHVAARSLNWGSLNYTTFVKLRSSDDTAITTKNINDIYRLNTGGSSDYVAYLKPLKEIHFESDVIFSQVRHANKSQVYILAGLAIILLVVASVNYINLVLAKTVSRGREIAMKKVIGARKSDILYQFIAESALTCFIAFLVAFAIIEFSLPSFKYYLKDYTSLDIFSYKVWLILIVTFLATIALTTLYPALLFATVNPLTALRGKSILGIKKNTFTRVLVIVQFTSTIVFAIFTLTELKQMSFIQSGDAAYSQAQILSINLPPQLLLDSAQNKESIVKLMKDRILSFSGVQGVSMTDQPIENIENVVSGGIRWDGMPSDLNPSVSVLSADEGFQAVFNPILISGRWFNNDIADRHNYIINETALKDFRIPSPAVGVRLNFQKDTGIIIGVVKDFHYRSYHEKITPLFISNDPRWRLHLFVKLNPKDHLSSTLGKIEAIWKNILPSYPYTYSFLDDSFNKLYESDRANLFLTGLLSIITIAISSLGLLGLSSLSIGLRMKEIMIRKQLGASVEKIFVWLLRSFLWPVALSLVIGSPIAWLISSSWLQSFAYRINMSYWSLIQVCVSILLISAISVIFVFLKAAFAKPAAYLRSE